MHAKGTFYARKYQVKSLKRTTGPQRYKRRAAGRGRGPLWVLPTWNMEHGGILSMPDFNSILICDQNDVFDHFLILPHFCVLCLLFTQKHYFVVSKKDA